MKPFRGPVTSDVSPGNATFCIISNAFQEGANYFARIPGSHRFIKVCGVPFRRDFAQVIIILLISRDMGNISKLESQRIGSGHRNSCFQTSAMTKESTA